MRRAIPSANLSSVHLVPLCDSDALPRISAERSMSSRPEIILIVSVDCLRPISTILCSPSSPFFDLNCICTVIHANNMSRQQICLPNYGLGLLVNVEQEA